jgi:hypothetical protein
MHEVNTMRTRTLMIVVAVGCTVATAVPTAHAAGLKRARFLVTVQGLETTKWSSHSGTLTDCNGKHYTTGEGTEVIRIDSGRPEKLLVQGFGGAPQETYGTWDPYRPIPDLGLWSAVKVTRHGTITHTITGGWCGSGSVTDTGPYDCGARRGSATALLTWHDGRRVEVEATTKLYKDYENCPVATPLEATPASWTAVVGRLSSKLLFGSRRQIVMVAGKTYRYKDAFREATTTTYVKVTLRRHGR